MLPTRVLGQTGLNVTQLGYGSMGLRGPKTWGVRVVGDADAERVLNAVLDLGINFIDTAPDYGLSEERIGRSIGHRRQEFVLATKCGCDYRQADDHLEMTHTWTKEVIQRNLELSLKRLQTDFIDIYQFHGGTAETLQKNGLIELLQSFRDQGVIHQIGVSSSLPELPALIKLDLFDTFQIPYSCLAPQHGDLMQQAADRGAGIIVRGGIAHGGPDAKIQRDALNQVWTTARLDELLPEGVNRAELILRYTLTHPACHTAIVGTCDLQHLRENTHVAARGSLSPELFAEISTRVQQAQLQLRAITGATTPS